MTTPDHPLDELDELASFRARFSLPEDVIYLDGNSLGPLSSGVVERVTDTVRQGWGRSLIRAWNDHGWIDWPERLGDRLAALIGAVPGSVTVTDTLSLNVAKAVSAALEMTPGRKLIVSDTGNFPSDVYMVEGLLRGLGADHEIRLVEPEQVLESIDERVAIVMLTQVDYRTGRLHDIDKITARVHAAGAVSFWDLAHSAGALPIDVTGANVDFAAGCTYKYLNGGPGAPGFIYAKPALIDNIQPLLSGWLGSAEPFAFESHYRPAKGIRRLRVGTPPVLALAALEAALDVWTDIDVTAVRRKSCALGDLFIDEVERRCSRFGLTLASPRRAVERGSQVTFKCEQGYAVMAALVAHGVIGDYRAPDSLRFGFAPLYLRYADVVQAAAVLEDVLENETYKRPEFQNQPAVT